MLTPADRKAIQEIIDFCSEYPWRMTGTVIHVDAEATEHYTPESPVIFTYNQLMDGILPAIGEPGSQKAVLRVLKLSYPAYFALTTSTSWDGASYEGRNSIFRLKGYGEQTFDVTVREALCKLLD